MLTKIKNFLNKIYDKTVVYTYAIIGMLVSSAGLFVALSGTAESGLEWLNYVAIVLFVLAVLYSIVTLVSSTHRRLLFAKSKEDVKALRMFDAEKHEAKTIKQAKKQIKSEEKSNRL